MITAEKIVELLKNDANRRAKTGDKRGARTIRNALALIYTAKPEPSPIVVDPASEFLE